MPLDCADAKACEIIVVICIHAGHFCGFATDERAARKLASFGNARDDRRGRFEVKLAARIIVEKEKRLGPLHDQIICAHRDQIDANPFVPPRFDGEFQLRADAVIGGNQQRISKACRAQIEKPAKTAKISRSSGPARGLGKRRYRADKGVASGDRYTSLSIGIGLGLIMFGLHFVPVARTGLEFHAQTANRAIVLNKSRLARLGPLALAVAAASMGAVLYAQIEGTRGVSPVGSASALEVTGITVDVAAKTAYQARMGGWREAQRRGWRLLWAKYHGGSLGAPGLSDSALDGIVSSIIIEDEQIGETRYIARLGVQFDRVRAGQILGVSGTVARSAPLLLVPVQWSGGTATSYETNSPWLLAWANFNASASAIDYVRPNGRGADPLQLNYGQTARPGRRRWRALLDQYGAADVLIPTVRLERMWPGGPVIGHFTARYGPDNLILDNFTLRVETSANLPAMMAQGVRRMDEIYANALGNGVLRPDTSLVLETPVEPEDLLAEELPAEGELTGIPAETTGEPRDSAAPAAGVQGFTLYFETPDVGSVTSTESSVRSIPGVKTASTTSLALGGTSVMRVSFAGDSGMLRLALAARGFAVSESGGTLTISR